MGSNNDTLTMIVKDYEHLYDNQMYVSYANLQSLKVI